MENERTKKIVSAIIYLCGLGWLITSMMSCSPEPKYKVVKKFGECVKVIEWESGKRDTIMNPKCKEL